MGGDGSEKHASFVVCPAAAERDEPRVALARELDECVARIAGARDRFELKRWGGGAKPVAGKSSRTLALTPGSSNDSDSSPRDCTCGSTVTTSSCPSDPMGVSSEGC